MKTESHIEALDIRIAPAGVVVLDYNAATGAVTLTGDGEDNIVSIFRTGPKSFRVEGFDDTLIDRVGGDIGDFSDIGKINSLDVSLGGGADELFLSNVSATSATFSFDDGNDFMLADNLIVKGTVTVNFGNDGGEAIFGGPVTTLGNLFVTSASGSSRIDFQAAATTIKGVLSLAGSGGDDRLASSGSLTIAKGIVVNGNGGNDSIDFDGPGRLILGKSSTGQSIDFNGGSGNDEIFLGHSTITLAGFVDFSAGGGSNGLFLGGGQSVLKMGASSTGASIMFVGGPDDDSIEINTASVTLAGGIDFDGGVAGTNVLDIDQDGNVKIGKIKASGLSISFNGGDDNDEVFLGGNIVTLAGGIGLNGLGGANFLDVDGENVTIGKAISGDAISFSSGNGNDEVDIEGARVTLKGRLHINTAGGQDRVEISDLVFFTATSIIFEGGDGNDFFQFAPHIANVLGKVDLLGGGGNDQITFQADGLIKGDLTVDVEDGDDQQDIFISGFSGLPGNLRVLGSLTVFSFGNVASFDSIVLRDLTVGKTTTIDIGDGDSFTTIDNLIARGALNILTQGGDDTLLFERAAFFGTSLVTKAANIDMGDGADTLRIGNSTVTAIAEHNRVRFLAAVTINGGSGDDEINTDLLAANVFAIPPIVTGFE